MIVDLPPVHRKVLVKYSSVGWIEVKGDGPDHDPMARVWRFAKDGSSKMALLRDIRMHGDRNRWYDHAYHADRNFIFA